MKTLKEKIAVMQAFADGKKIEFIRYSSTNTNDWIENPNPCWDWFNFDYRVKSELKSRPFKDANECLKDVLTHGGWIKDRNHGVYYTITGIGNSGCQFNGRFSMYQDLFLYYVWADDESVCGVLEKD